MLNMFNRAAPRLLADRIVSLGALCEVAFQVRRLSRAEQAYPFDWWITPLAGVAPVLEAGAAAVFAPQEIVKVSDYGGKAALYSRLGGTVHLHEFPAGEDFLALSEEAISGRLVAKYAMLQERMVSTCRTGTTLFVRQRLREHDPQGPALEAALDRLFGCLSTLAADPRLLLLDYAPVAPRPWLVTAQIPAYRDHNDLGSRRGWNATFRACGIACPPSGTRFRYDDLTATLEKGRR
ncbi:hypothetical protein EZH22_19405 [Xanthobacter dioxanivorans]|uniref:Uncharacterized protein n=1 Tax=Xanthobacter dioxanivorans TaxID=2528964 RepID=A0A974PKH3_9HYPH|nr:DUF1796 family putative cysteine peptidase [Xanthobacter dioxanivorans]QRG05252.1 hypothetical protein EZH22_19405 [Xanthobacter dioxanivorans]